MMLRPGISAGSPGKALCTQITCTMRPSLVALALAAAIPVAASAQTIAPFDLGRSPIALSGDARAGQYVSAVGRRAIAMGTEDGAFELWSWPYKWMHDLKLSFRVPKYTQAIPGRDVARSVLVRPEGVTITYAYETFTVKQTVFASIDKPAVIMLLEVDAIRPMRSSRRSFLTCTWPGRPRLAGNMWRGARGPRRSSSARAAARSAPSSARPPSRKRATSPRTC